MRIDRLEGYLLRLPLKQPTRISDSTVEHCIVVVVRLEGEGRRAGAVAPGNSPLITSEWSVGTYRPFAIRSRRVLDRGAWQASTFWKSLTLASGQ